MQLYKDEIDKEMILNAEIQRQNLKSLPKGGIKDRKIKTPVSQQMIDEFKQQFNKKSGDKAFLFPELKPNLIDLTSELNKIQQPLTNDQIIEATTDLNKYTEEYKLIENTTIPDYRRGIAENIEKINKQESLFDSGLKMPNSKRTKKAINDIKKLKEDNKTLENNIITNTIKMQNLLSNINLIKEIITRNNEIADNYSNLKFSIEQKNKKILSDYSDNIRILNEGKINISQDPDETEEEYLIRLADIAEQEYDDSELLEKAYLSNIIEFKQNMKNILSTEWKIENILNSLDRDEVFLLNKTFKSFEREILKTIGKNNKNIEIGDYVQLIKNHTKTGDIEKIDAKTIIARPVETIDESIYEEEEPVEASSVSIPKYTFLGEEDDDIIYELSSDRETLSMSNKLNNRNVYLSFGYQNQVFYKLPYGGLTEFKGNKNTRTFKEKFDSIFKVYLEMNDEQLKREFGEKYEEITEQKLAAKLKKQRLQYIHEDMYIGKGIKKLKENLPAFLQFGKVIILLDKLYYKNTLSIKDKNKKNIQGLPNKKVSDKFVDIIMRMIKDDKPAGSGDIYELDDKEQELFTILMYKSGFYKETTTNNKKIIQKLKDRLQLVEGEIKAGNNNEDNFKELYQIIFKMTNLGVISLSNGRSYYKQIKKEYS
jgi:hypothetical protein